MAEVTTYHTVKIGRELISVTQKAFRNGKRQVFKNKYSARSFISEVRAKSNVKG